MENGTLAPKEQMLHFPIFFKYMIFQRCQKVLLWSKGLNMYMQLSSETRNLNFGLSLHLCPYFMCVSSEVSSKPTLLVNYAVDMEISSVTLLAIGYFPANHKLVICSLVCLSVLA